MEYFASQDPRSYSFYFDLNIWFRARKVNGTFEKQAPGHYFKCRGLAVNRLNKNVRDYAYCFLEKYIFLTINIEFSDNSFSVVFFCLTLEFVNGI